MREIHVQKIIKTVKKMCMESNFNLSNDVKQAIKNSYEIEESPLGKAILSDLIKNEELASDKRVPMCQDTGMAVFFIDVGQEVCIKGGSLTDAINEGVRQGYKEGYLRKSIVKDPLIRENTKDNTPAVIHYDILPGDQMIIRFAPKGFGSENMSRAIMLKPSDGIEGVEEFVLKTISLAGPNPCPPIVVGVGIGGTIDKAAQLAKRALFRDLNMPSEKKHLQNLEKRLLKKINNLGIGPQGLGGRTTALSVAVESFPTHIAGLPVVVNINCHACRHMTCSL